MPHIVPLLFILLLAGCGPVIVADSAQKRELIQRLHTNVWSDGQLEQLPQLIGEDFVASLRGTSIDGRAAFAAYLREQQNERPPLKISATLIEESRGAARLTRELDGRSIHYLAWYRFDRGRIQELVLLAESDG